VHQVDFYPQTKIGRYRTGGSGDSEKVSFQTKMLHHDFIDLVNGSCRTVTKHLREEYNNYSNEKQQQTIMQARPTTIMTVDDFSKYIQNKRDLYEACTRNGYYLTSKKSTMATKEFMRNVIKGSAWCPKKAKIKMLGCPRPPNKSELLDKFWNYIDFNRLELLWVDKEKHIPDKRWLLDILATFTPEDEIIEKGYNPPERASKLSEIKTIEVLEDFMKDLPFSRRKTKRKGLRI
jgi:hypothetical protein